MNKKIFLRIIGVIFLFVASNNNLALSGSFSFLFLAVGIVSIGYSVFVKCK